jgi:hypothetical protein
MRVRPSLELLEDRVVPTTAAFSNGMLTVLGDNQGNSISVSADSSGILHVSERGQEVAISSSTTATLSNTTLVCEQAGTGSNNTLASDASLGSVATSFLGNGGGVITYPPGNNAPLTAYGSPDGTAVNHFLSNPGGRDVFHGGQGDNLFDWQPGTGSDCYYGAGKLNAVLVVGNSGGLAENDTLSGDGRGDVLFSRLNLVPFTLTTTNIQDWYIEPSTGAGNTVTIGDMSGTITRRVGVDASCSTVNAAAQNDSNVRLVVNGTRDTVSEGAGPTVLKNTTAPTAADIISAMESRLTAPTITVA